MMNHTSITPNSESNTHLPIQNNTLIAMASVSTISALVIANMYAEDDYTELMQAAKAGNTDKVQALVRQLSAAEINWRSKSGQTALSVATEAAAKYLIYSGKLLPTPLNIEEAIARLKILSTRKDKCYQLLVRTWNMLASINSKNKDPATSYISLRTKLLTASICGVSLSEHNMLSTGLHIAKFKILSYLMKVNKLTKLVYDSNKYFIIHTILLRKDELSAFKNMDFDMKINILNFLTADDLRCAVPDLVAATTKNKPTTEPLNKQIIESYFSSP